MMGRLSSELAVHHEGLDINKTPHSIVPPDLHHLESCLGANLKRAGPFPFCGTHRFILGICRKNAGFPHFRWHILHLSRCRNSQREICLVSLWTSWVLTLNCMGETSCTLPSVRSLEYSPGSPQLRIWNNLGKVYFVPFILNILLALVAQFSRQTPVEGLEVCMKSNIRLLNKISVDLIQDYIFVGVIFC